MAERGRAADRVTRGLPNAVSVGATDRAIEQLAQPLGVDPIGARRQRKHRVAIAQKHERFDDLAELTADRSSRLLGGTGALGKAEDVWCYSRCFSPGQEPFPCAQARRTGLVAAGRH